jgi:hypothetical protein
MFRKILIAIIALIVLVFLFQDISKRLKKTNASAAPRKISEKVLPNRAEDMCLHVYPDLDAWINSGLSFREMPGTIQDSVSAYRVCNALTGGKDCGSSDDMGDKFCRIYKAHYQFIVDTLNDKPDFRKSCIEFVKLKPEIKTKNPQGFYDSMCSILEKDVKSGHIPDCKEVKSTLEKYIPGFKCDKEMERNIDMYFGRFVGSESKDICESKMDYPREINYCQRTGNLVSAIKGGKNFWLFKAMSSGDNGICKEFNKRAATEFCAGSEQYPLVRK